MTLDNLKQKVKASFIGVDSEEFLQVKISEQELKHQSNFNQWKDEHPGGSLQEWKNQQEMTANVNTTNNEEIMAIGIYLLALDLLN